MSNVGFNSSLLGQNGQDLSPAEQLMADLKQLAQDSKGGNLPALQQDYVTLSQDLASTEPSAAASAAEAGVIVSLLSDLLSQPISPTGDPRQLIPPTVGFDYGLPLFSQSQIPQNVASSIGSATPDFATSGVANTVPQTLASDAATSAGIAVSTEPAHAIARSAEAGDIALVVNAALQRASTSASSIPDQESQATAAVLTGLSSNSVNPLIPGLSPDSSVVLPWTLFDWQLYGDRSQPIPSEFLRKRKSPRGSAARTRTKRRKP